MKDDSGWISVNERLPLQGEMVLVISRGLENNHHDIYLGCLGRVEDDPDGKMNIFGFPTAGSEWTLYGWSYFKAPQVTHWMPLPDPPKEGE